MKSSKEGMAWIVGPTTRPGVIEAVPSGNQGEGNPSVYTDKPEQS